MEARRSTIASPQTGDKCKMEPQVPKYDVAISFLSGDMSIAKALADNLKAGLRVFFYPRNQEELSGTDGLVTMRLAFMDESRVTVVLYREKWGQTPWTRLEESAIKDGCLQFGWNRLFFMSLDDSAALPIWLPQTHIAFSYKNFPIEQAAGAIKARVQEAGGAISPITALDRARLIQAEAQRIAKRQQLFKSQQWISENVQPTIDRLFSEIARLSNQISKETGMPVRLGSNPDVCALTDGRVSVAVRWNADYLNVMGDLSISQYYNVVILPGEHKQYLIGRPPTEQERQVLLPDLSADENICWVCQNEPHERFSTESAADKIIQIFLDLSEKAVRGDIDITPEFHRQLQNGWQEKDW